MGIYSLDLQRSPTFLIVLKSYGRYSAEVIECAGSQLHRIVRNRIAYLTVVKTHYMARKLRNISGHVQKGIQQETTGKVSNLIRATDEVDQVRRR